MPLRALLDEQDIFAFHYDKESWQELRKNSLRMPCCGERAIPKTSKLGTRFFSHFRRGDCESHPESAEHLYLKNLVAGLAEASGWDVVTEKPGKTPDGEEWIADVFCQKGDIKFVLEIQWSHQSRDEFIRRQKKYTSSGIRAAWLFKLRNNKKYENHELPYGRETPVFGIKHEPGDNKKFFVPQFDEPFESFVEGLLHGKLQWVESHTNPGKVFKESIRIIPYYIRCWECGRKTGVILGIAREDQSGRIVKVSHFYDTGIPEFILKHVDQTSLKSSNIGIIKIREHAHKPLGISYISNGCIHCDSFVVTPRTLEPLTGHLENRPIRVPPIEITYRGGDRFIKGGWYFIDNPSKRIF